MTNDFQTTGAEGAVPSGPSFLSSGTSAPVLSACISCRQRTAVVWADFGDERFPVCAPCAPTNIRIPEWLMAE